MRIPDHPIIQELIEALGRPLVSTSLHDLDEIVAYPSDPELIAEQWESVVDVVVDGDFGHIVASTIIDCTSGEAVLLREGAGSSDIL